MHNRATWFWPVICNLWSMILGTNISRVWFHYFRRWPEAKNSCTTCCRSKFTIKGALLLPISRSTFHMSSEVIRLISCCYCDVVPDIELTYYCLVLIMLLSCLSHDSSFYCSSSNFSFTLNSCWEMCWKCNLLRVRNWSLKWASFCLRMNWVVSLIDSAQDSSTSPRKLSWTTTCCQTWKTFLILISKH